MKIFYKGKPKIYLIMLILENQYLNKSYKLGIYNISVKNTNNELILYISLKNPGLLIGYKGENLTKFKNTLFNIFNKKIRIIVKNKNYDW